jgi:4a-hydroxytetrahydrobiopterin dehydratase
MARPQKLTDAEVTQRLGELPGWKRQGDALVKTFELPSFPRAIEVVNAVARRANELDHHPDMLIQYSKLGFTLSTHDAGGITDLDAKLAGEIERLAK